MARLLATAVVAVGLAVVLANEPSTSVCPHLQETELSALDPHDALFDRILLESDDVVESLTQLADSCQAMQDLAQPVLRWYEFIEQDLRLDPDRDHTIEWQLKELSQALLQGRPAAVRFVTTMKPRSACDLLEKILHHPDVRYDRRAKLLNSLRSLNPKLFSVDIGQIPPAILSVLGEAYNNISADDLASTKPASPESIEILEQLFPDPLHKFVRYHKQMQAQLIEYLQASGQDVSADSRSHINMWSVAIPPLARLGIRLHFTDCLSYDGFPYSVYPYQSTKGLWKTVRKWLESEPESNESLRHLTRIMMRLLSVPEFIRDVRDHPHTFGLFVIFLHEHCPLAYTRIFTKVLQEHEELIAIKDFVIGQIRQRDAQQHGGTGPFEFIKACFADPSEMSDT